MVCFQIICVTIFFLFGIYGCRFESTSDLKYVKNLITQWAPLIWLSPNEEYFPSGIEYFLRNVYLTNQHQNISYPSLSDTISTNIDTSLLFLTPKNNLADELNKKDSFLYGLNQLSQVPIYALISFCSPSNSFHASNLKNIKHDISLLFGKIGKSSLFFQVTYWTFYPYNKGKQLCFLGKVPTPYIFGTCFGRLKTIGSHVGDWEHITLTFRGLPVPSDMYLAVHDAGASYKYDFSRRIFQHNPQSANNFKRKPTYPATVWMQMGHPVLFAANGSHGLWSSPGEHQYVKIPRLVDVCGYGFPWKTWNNLKMFVPGYDELPKWMLFRGKWGNPSSNCVISQKLGLCEHYGGPRGILRKKLEFIC